MNSVEVCGKIASETDTILLAFSCGKDSLAAWLALRPNFRRIVPVYKYLVPNLGFVAESLSYYEREFGEPIIQVPHPSLFRWLNNFTFQAPEHLGVIDDIDPPNITHEQTRDIACDKSGLPRGTWIAVGTRDCDSPQRRMAFTKYGAINQKSRTFYPVWDWNKAAVMNAIRESGIKLPAEYRIFGRSFDGLDLRFLWGIRKHWPDDYRKILEWFPMAETEVKRYEFAQAKRRHAERCGTSR